MVSAPHITVFLDGATKYLAPERGGIIVDSTMGFAGHSEAILTVAKRSGVELKLIGIDRDKQAIEFSRNRLARFEGDFYAVHGNFGEIISILRSLGIEKIDGLLADLGVSSLQFDDPVRGFSFRNKGPLDMRMNQEDPYDLMALLNSVDEEDLIRIFREYGELPSARSIAKALLRARDKGEVTDTITLAKVINDAVGRETKKRSIPPATIAFMALRIAINDEMGELERLLDSLDTILNVGGRAVFISFHSLEDRMVKRWIAKRTKRASVPRTMHVAPVGDEPDYVSLTKKALTATPEEIMRNPRSASAKLRAVERVKISVAN